MEIVETLRQDGVTIILTTHYIEEAEAIADRIGVINNGELLLVEEKDALMRRMGGQKQLRLDLSEPLTAIPPESLSEHPLELTDEGGLVYHFESGADRTGITRLLSDVAAAGGLKMIDLDTSQSSLEEIFVTLVTEDAQ